MYEWCNYCTAVGYQIITDKEAGVIKIRNQNTSMVLILCEKNMLYLYQPQISRYWKMYFETLQANWVWMKMEENRGRIVFVIPRNKIKLRHWFIIQNFLRLILKNRYVSFNFSTVRLLAPISIEYNTYFANLAEFKMTLIDMSNTASQKCKLSNIFYFNFTAHKSYGQAPNWTSFPRDF